MVGTGPRPAADILLVDDRPENLLLLRTILEPLGERIVCAPSGEQALREMLRNEFALVLLDVRMPGMDGYETATVIKSRERTAHVPIIFLTAADVDDVNARRGYDVGAVDYLYKPFDPVVLRSKVSVFMDLHHLKREAEALAHRALHDPLTGLPNRTLFEDRLSLAVSRTARSDASAAVFYLDLDDFKPVNDLYGHDVGDALLIELANRLRSVLRPSDTIARLGGDEFAVVSDAVQDHRDAERIARRIMDAVAAPYAVAEGKARVTVSIGIALVRAPVEPRSLLRGADTAMYAAKSAGGNAFRVHDALVSA
jgi:diguanylate cyclase (GGDEF)-like protein